MIELNSYSLEKHTGNYNHWPRSSKLLKDEAYTGHHLTGYCIERQFLLNNGHYFFITSYECPFEEQCDMILLNKAYKTLAKRSLIPWHFSSWNFDKHEYIEENIFILTFNETYRLKVSLNPNSFFRFRRILLSRIR